VTFQSFKLMAAALTALQGLAQLAHLLGRAALFPDIKCDKTKWAFTNGKPTSGIPTAYLDDRWHPWGDYRVGKD
jgi:hypothetical protein